MVQAQKNDIVTKAESIFTLFFHKIDDHKDGEDRLNLLQNIIKKFTLWPTAMELSSVIYEFS